MLDTKINKTFDVVNNENVLLINYMLLHEIIRIKKLNIVYWKTIILDNKLIFIIIFIVLNFYI